MPKLITASFKQRKFVHEYLRHGNASKAARDVYQSPQKYSALKGREVLSHPMTQEYIRKIMNDAGMTPEKIGKALHTILDATLTTESLKMATPAHGLKAIEIAARLQDMNPAEKKKIEKKTLNLSLEGKSLDELNEMLSTLTEEARTFKRLIKKETQDAEVLS